MTIFFFVSMLLPQSTDATRHNRIRKELRLMIDREATGECWGPEYVRIELHHGVYTARLRSPWLPHRPSTEFPLDCTSGQSRTYNIVCNWNSVLIECECCYIEHIYTRTVSKIHAQYPFSYLTDGATMTPINTSLATTNGCDGGNS